MLKRRCADGKTPLPARAPVQAGPACQNAPLPEYPVDNPPIFPCRRPSRAADPDSVADAHRRPRHRPFRLCAGAAGHARHAGLVVFRGRLHEHHQCRRAISPARWSRPRLIRRFGLSAALRWGTLAGVLSLALCALTGNFIVLSLARLLAGVGAAAGFVSGGALAATIAQSRPERANFLLSLFYAGPGLGIAPPA